MELVPILSAIILAFTIATFILAIAAYVNYKLRERSRKKKKAAGGGNLVVAPAPAPPPHVLVEATGTPPALQAAQQATAYLPPPQKNPAFLPPPSSTDFSFPSHDEPEAVPLRPVSDSFFETTQAYIPEPEPEAEAPGSMFWEYTEDGFVPMAPEGGRTRSAPNPFATDEQKAKADKSRAGNDTMDDNAWL